MKKLVSLLFSIVLVLSLIGCTKEEKLVLVMECQVCGDVLEEVAVKKDNEGLELGSGIGFCNDCFAKEKEIIRVALVKVPIEEPSVETIVEPIVEPIAVPIVEPVKEPAKVVVNEETETCEECGKVEVISKLHHLHGYGYFHLECYEKLEPCAYCGDHNINDSNNNDICNDCEAHLCDRCGAYSEIPNSETSPNCDDCEEYLEYYDKVGCMCEYTTIGRNLAGTTCDDCGTEYYLIIP